MEKQAKVATAQDTPEKNNEPEKEALTEELPIWTFPLEGRSVRAKTLKEAEEKIKANKQT